MLTVSVTETAVFTAMRSFILGVIDCEVVRGLNNRVPMPAGGFIALSPLFANRLSTNRSEYTDDTQTITQPTQYVMQIDCYGVQSCDWATMLTTLLRDEYSTSRFPAEIQPLHADDPKQIALVNDEQQYEQRWMITANLQVNPAILIEIETANTLGDVSLYPVL